MTLYEDYEFETWEEFTPPMISEESTLDTSAECLPHCSVHDVTFHHECLRCALEALREQERPVEYRRAA